MSTVLLDGTEQLINGLMYGCFYALIGGGFTLLFGVLRRFNLAYGSTIMAGAYAGLIPVYLFNAPVLVLFVTTIVVSVLVGLLVEFCCFRFLRKGHELAPLMTTIGMLIVIDETIVYLTDAASAAGKVDSVTIPDAQNAVASYPAATLKASRQADAAAEFVKWLSGEEAQKILRDAGFQQP